MKPFGTDSPASWRRDTKHEAAGHSRERRGAHGGRRPRPRRAYSSPGHCSLAQGPRVLTQAGIFKVQYRPEFSPRIGKVFSELVLFCTQVVSLLRGPAVWLTGSPRMRRAPRPAGSSLAEELVGTGGDGSPRLSEGDSSGGRRPPDTWAPALGVPQLLP